MLGLDLKGLFQLKGFHNSINPPLRSALGAAAGLSLNSAR